MWKKSKLHTKQCLIPDHNRKSDIIHFSQFSTSASEFKSSSHLAWNIMVSGQQEDQSSKKK
jgi:hypothetical protein